MNYFPKSVCVFGILIFAVFQNSYATEVEKGVTTDVANITFSSQVDYQDARCGIYRLNSSLYFKIQSLYFQNEDKSSVNKCTWEFYGTEECNPAITCDTFDLLESPSCDTEFLELYDASGGEAKFCGTNAPNLASSSSILIANFKTEAQNIDKGFHCSVACAQPGMVTSLGSFPSTRKNKPKETKSCGKPGSKKGNRIIGGQNTTWEKYPWHLSLEQYGSNFCGGSLIAPNKVLTAAHCTDGKQASRLSIRIGTSTLNEGGKVIQVDSKCEHPNYIPWDDYLNDVVVLTLKDSFEGTTICIPPVTTDLDKYAGQLGTLTGWGYLGTGKPQPKQLQRLVLPLNKWAECKKAHGSSIHDSQTCFGAPEKGQCSGDSGGALVVEGDSGKYFQNGIVSWSVKPCGREGYPGVFVRVTDPGINAFITSRLASSSGSC